MLALPRLGCINLHASLLPRTAAPRRFSGPWPRAMPSPATPPCCSKRASTPARFCCNSLGIAPELTAVELFDELAEGGAPLVVKTLAGLADGSIQPGRRITRSHLAPLLNREDGRMDFAAYTATELKNRWRGFQPWPGAFTTLDGKKLIVHRMSVVDASTFSPRNRLSPARFTSKAIVFLSPAPRTPGWNFSKFSSKAKSGSRPAEFLRGAALGCGCAAGAATQ
jgi:methionyl-tRNA formyltransferase